MRDKILFFTDISSSGLILLFLESWGRRRVLPALDQRLQVGDHKAQGIEHNPSHDNSFNQLVASATARSLREIIRTSSATAAAVTATMVEMPTSSP